MCMICLDIYVSSIITMIRVLESTLFFSIWKFKVCRSKHTQFVHFESGCKAKTFIQIGPFGSIICDLPVFKTPLV